MPVHKRLPITLVLIGMVAAVAGCGADGGVKSPAAFDVFVDGPSVLPAVPLSAEPIWSSDQLPIKHVADVQFRGSTAIVTGTAETNTSTAYVAAVDAATGAMKWSIRTLDELPGGDGAVLWDAQAYVAGTAENWVVLVDYFSSDCAQPSGMCPPGTVDSTSEQGVAALSPQDGSVLWKVPGVPSVPDDSEEADDLDDLSALVVAASDSLALLVVAPTDLLYGSRFVDPDKIAIIALNPLDGSTLWTTTGSVPQQIIGDVVLTSVPPEGPNGVLADKPGTPAALDVTSGQPLWSLVETYPQARVVALSSGAMVISQIEKVAPRNTLLRMSDGTKISDLGFPSMRCVSDSAASIIACSMHGDPGKDRLMTYQSGDAGIKISKRPIPESMITAVWNGYVFYGGYSKDSSYGAVDQFGNVVSAQLPGRVVTVTDQYAVFDTTKKANTDPGSFAVYGIAA